MKAITIKIDDTTELSILDRPVMIETISQECCLTIVFSGGAKKEIYLESADAVLNVKEAIMKTFGIS